MTFAARLARRSIPSLLIFLSLASCGDSPVEPEPFEGEPSEELLYVEVERGLFLLNVVTGEVTQVTSSDVIRAADPEWSPDGERIVFGGRGELGTPFDIFVVDADGGNLRRITDTPVDEYRPTWSPDGRRLAYERLQRGARDLMVVEVDGGSPTALVTGMAARDLTWSPDGQRIAFIGGRISSFSEIYVIEVDGTRLRQLTNDTTRILQDLQWSPAGDRLVYTEFPTPSGDTELFTIRPDGTNRRRITNNSSTEVTPLWSPDGRRISFQRYAGGFQAVHVIDADGGDEVLLNSPGTDFEIGPAWNPDAKRLAFSGCFNAEGAEQDCWLGGSQVDLFVIDADGTNLEQLTDTPSEKWVVGWRP